MTIEVKGISELEPLEYGSDWNSISTWPLDPGPPRNSNPTDPLVIALIIIACVPIIALLVVGVVLLLALCLAVCFCVFLTVALAFASALATAAQD